MREFLATKWMMRKRFLLLAFATVAFCAGSSGVRAQTASPANQNGSPEPRAPDSDSLSDAKRLIDEGKLDDAIQNLNALQQQHPETRGLQYQLGLAYYRKGDFAQAQSALGKAMDQDPQNREAVQLRGLSLVQMGRPAEAIPYLKQVQSWMGSVNVDAVYVLGLCYVHTQNYDEARRSFAQMYGVPPDSAQAHLFLARMLLRQGYDPVAEQNAQRAAAMDPKLPLVHYLLGEFYLYKSNVQKAIDEFEAEQKLNPAYAGTYDRLGDSYSRLSRYDDAQRALQRAILLDATATGPYILMGKVLIKKKDFASASNYLQKALRMDPSNYMSHHLMGEAYRGLGRTADAERELKKAEELQSAQGSKPE